ncbi:MAG: ribulose-phosphate 3-epimerase [Candidatus Brocadiales bacterium]
MKPTPLREPKGLKSHLKINIAASILAADPLHFAQEIQKVQEGGVDLIHVDIMDGHFVPNLTMGPFIVEGIKKIASVPLDLHLMVEYPSKFIEPFRQVSRKGDYFTFHIESKEEPRKVISLIREAGFRVGISLNPPTQAEKVEGLLGDVDLLLVMTVNPGFAGQKFIEDVMPKLRYLRSLSPELDIMVDGGINEETVPTAARHGANIMAAARGIFGKKDPAQAVGELRRLAQDNFL